jgi:hypothetical protein
MPHVSFINMSGELIGPDVMLAMAPMLHDTIQRANKLYIVHSRRLVIHDGVQDPIYPRYINETLVVRLQPC